MNASESDPYTCCYETQNMSQRGWHGLLFKIILKTGIQANLHRV